MKKEILLKNLEEGKADAFKNLFVRDILTSKDNDKISFHYCRMEPQGEIADDQHECIEVYYFLKGEGKAKVGNDTLRPRLLELLSGHARESLLHRVREAHRALPALDDDYRDFLRAELDAWRGSNPRVVRFLRSLDHAAALARPAITVSLAVSGFVLAGDLVGQAAVQAAGHTAGELATEAAIAGGITGGGEVVVSTAGEGVRQAAGRLFGRLQSRYARQRADWLARWLEQELLGDLLAELRRGAEVPQSSPFGDVEQALEALRSGGGITA